MCFSNALQLAMQNEDASVLEASLSKEPASKRQQKLNQCLTVVLGERESSLKSIKMLLDLGAKLDLPATYHAKEREDLGLLQMLLEYGWDIQSTKYSSCPIQYARLPNSIDGSLFNIPIGRQSNTQHHYDGCSIKAQTPISCQRLAQGDLVHTQPRH